MFGYFLAGLSAKHRIGSKADASQTSRERRVSFESLEGRDLMAGNITAALDSRGLLTVRGSDGNDGIYISQANNRISVQGVRTFNASQVRAIAVQAGAGNDEVVLLNSSLRSGVQDIRVSTYIDAGAGNDLVTGGVGFDFIDGGDGNDTIYGTWGDDLIGGGFGDDTVYAGEGNDLVFGSYGSDVLYGQGGSDLLDGGWGVDGLVGGEGNDVLIGGQGYDYLWTGTGTNYVADSDYAYTWGGGSDWSLTSSQAYSAAPTTNWQPTTALQSILGPELYNGIFVNKTIPNYFRNTA